MLKHTGERFSLPQRMLCLFFVLVMALALLPASSVQADEKQYGRVNYDKVRFRRQAEKTDVWCNLDSGWVVEILGTKRSGGTDYYYVVSNIPNHLDRQYYGYISKQYVTAMTAEEVSAWQSAGGNASLVAAAGNTGNTGNAGSSVTPTPTAPPAVLTNYAQPTSASVNYYSYNGSALSSLGLLDQNTSYYVNGTATIGDTAYYIILVNGAQCYVKSSNMTMLTSGGSNPGSGSANQDPPAETPLGTVRVKLDGTTNMRSEAVIQSGNIIAYLQKNQELLYYYTVTSNGETWYNCYDAASGRRGFVLGSCLTVLSSSATPTPTPTAQVPGSGASNTVIGYVKITPEGSTHIREKAQVNVNNVLADAQQGDVLPYYAVTTVKGAAWYYVYYAPKGVFGYVLGSCCTLTNSEGQSLSSNTPTPTPPPASGAILGYIKFTAGGVNLREQASKKSPTLGQFDKGVILPYYNVVTEYGVTWYKVRTEKKEGWVHGDFCEVCDAFGNKIDGGNSGSTASDGYLMTTSDKVYIRKAASTTAGTYGQVAAKGTVLRIVGKSVVSGGVTWHKVEYEGNTGYIHGKYVSVLNADQINAYLNNQPMPTATPTPTPKPKQVDYDKVNTDKVWIRKSPSTNASTKGQANKGAVFQFTGKVTANGTQWYKIKFDDGEYYIMARYCDVMTDVEYNAYIASKPTPTPSPTPNVADLSNLAVTNIEKVIVRSEASPSAKQVSWLYKAGTLVNLQSNVTVSGGNYQWYHVTVNGVTGYIRSDLLRVLTKSEATAYQQSGGSSTKPEASYTTLQLGSTGEAVTKLQTRLKELGYLTAANITGTYDTATRDAVKAFQSTNKLTVDGIAGSLTQHALYGTVETGTYTGSGSSTTGVQLYTPELIDWYTGGIQSIFYKGCVATLTDVKTGISFKIKRWSGGDHADVEPLTAADTAAMCRVYGVKIAQDIADQDLWQRRAVLITIGTHSYCASIYGEPHNY
ncbi:MAG: SH3 domain-containing protein, partial [Clostridia bacterium]|nr:SH3 domain-containing protein [Clostridia bacterium]